jgi:hypothetical protein
MKRDFKTFCIKCKKTNACSCGTNAFQFKISYKLRPPTSKNKVVWRTFLNSCPYFFNMVPPSLYDEVNTFLKEIKWPKKHINGFLVPFVYDPENKPFYRKEKHD